MWLYSLISIWPFGPLILRHPHKRHRKAFENKESRLPGHTTRIPGLHVWRNIETYIYIYLYIQFHIYVKNWVTSKKNTGFHITLHSHNHKQAYKLSYIVQHWYSNYTIMIYIYLYIMMIHLGITILPFVGTNGKELLVAPWLFWPLRLFWLLQPCVNIGQWKNINVEAVKFAAGD